MAGRSRNPAEWMLSEAIAAMAEAERMHRQLFRAPRGEGPGPCWEPPVDVLETETEVLIHVALPGVDPEKVEAVIEDGQLVVRGRQSDDTERDFLHRGIAARQFQRCFVLADGMRVVAAELRNGLLAIDVDRPEPERLVRKINISARG